MESAIFLAGITGLRCQSEDGRNHWEMHLSHDTAHVREHSVLLRSLYEAQNPTILSRYFNANSDRRKITLVQVSLGPLVRHMIAMLFPIVWLIPQINSGCLLVSGEMMIFHLWKHLSKVLRTTASPPHHQQSGTLK